MNLQFNDDLAKSRSVNRSEELARDKRNYTLEFSWLQEQNPSLELLEACGIETEFKIPKVPRRGSPNQIINVLNIYYFLVVFKFIFIYNSLYYGIFS
ncbi:MAG: hypothetical protein S4CHLAM45_00360 [Chlamydiales bacterium]|nr:hypothetical protein [Chlamydiales bacterium]MCH9619360.1 hypothetical protein [Chlamydiales bacterium]MCH9622164.1 hypothetical protein [Chlamydiales bacterium]